MTPKISWYALAMRQLKNFGKKITNVLSVWFFQFCMCFMFNLRVCLNTVLPQFASPLMFVPVFNKNRRLLAMLDSGAEVNVIGDKLLKHLKFEELGSQSVELMGCGGSYKTSKWVKVPLKLSNGQHYDLIATVADSFGTAIILGSPFLRGLKVKIDYETNLMTTKFGSIPCYQAVDLHKSNELVNCITVTRLKDGDEKLLDDHLVNSVLSDDQKEKVKALLRKFASLWVDNPRGATHVIRHKITLDKPRIVRQKPRRFSPAEQKIIDEEIDKMLKAGVIRISNSPHAQEVVLVMKKTGDWRFCIDFRRLNDFTVSDEFPLPRISDLVRGIKDSKFFVALDLRSGYWQVLMDPDSIQYTAFRTRSGLYEFTVMPFGLKTAPATFSRLMDLVLGDMYWKGVCVYLDDVLVHSQTFEGVMTLLEEVLSRLKDANLTLAINKCEFFPKRLEYLGFIAEDGVLKPNIEKIEALKKIKTPRNVKDVRSLLGCVGYFRIFIPDFSRLAEPLNRLLRKGVRFQWSTGCEKARNELIDLLIRATLSNPLDSDFLKVETDASDTSISGALFCRSSEDDSWRPVEFLSKNLNQTQRNWPVHEREAFAIVHSLDKFDPYLRGRKFDVYTDNASLKWMNTTKKGKVARWAALLGEFDMNVIYRPGKTNVCADFLSRYVDNSPEVYLPDRAMLWHVSVKLPSVLDIIHAQKVESHPQSRSYIMKDGIVFFAGKIWVPPSQRLHVIEKYHNLMLYHHPGVKRTVAAIRKVFSWSGIQVDVTKYVRACLGCQRLRPGAESLQGFVTSHPVEGPFCRIHMDIYEVVIDGQTINCLTMIDNHTKWAECTVIPDKSARTIAEMFVKIWVSRFGCPQVLVTDNEKAFSGVFMDQLCSILGVKKLLITVKHSDGNAPIESFHRVLSKGFQRFVNELECQRIKMDEVLQLILYGYRLSYHSSVKDTPAYLTFGIDPRPPAPTFHNRCQPEHRERLEILNTIREDVIQKAYLKGIQQFAKNQENRWTEPLEIGELVLLPIDRAEAAVHAVNFRGRKVMPKYTMPYRVIRVFNQGRSAHCRNLCPLGRNLIPLREVSIQNLRRISPPLTQLQLEQWQRMLQKYYSEHVLDTNLRELLIKEFWEELDEPQADQTPVAKRKRHD